MPVRGTGRRYLAISVDGGGVLSEDEVSSAISDAVQDLFGHSGASSLEPRLIEFDADTRRGILRCSRSHMRDTRASLALITEISNEDAAVRVMGASGTIKSLKAAISGL